jgi:hypothetical protein
MRINRDCIARSPDHPPQQTANPPSVEDFGFRSRRPGYGHDRVRPFLPPVRWTLRPQSWVARWRELGRLDAVCDEWPGTPRVDGIVSSRTTEVD